jgi:hypothetical protein
MKIFNQGINLLLLTCVLTACEQDITVETGVHSDGSLDRTITFKEADSTVSRYNIFGISDTDGWDVTKQEWKQNDSDKKWIVQFRRTYASVNEANHDMNTGRDTLFSVKSGFEKRFRWFYTYMRYSDIYCALNRFRGLAPEDYFTKEDYSFIDRLPAEGKMISKADSLYLVRLNEKIFDLYATRAFFEEACTILSDVMKENGLEERWLDTLNVHKESLYRLFLNKQDNLDDDFMLPIADSLHIPLHYPKAREDYDLLGKDSERRVEFMSKANQGKFTHVIQMPWPVIRTNADSVAGTRVFWNPPVIKFMLKDYVMYAESRQVNYWAVLFSGAVMLFTLFLFIRRKNARRIKPG